VYIILVPARIQAEEKTLKKLVQRTYTSVTNIILRLLKIWVTVIGAAFVLLGVIFTAQSKALIGPTASFMYSNPSWSINGSVLIIIGIILLSIITFLKVKALINLKHVK
jgi:hypothetical protein